MTEQFLIEIEEDGEMFVKTSGFFGNACKVAGDKLKGLLSKLGVQVETEDIKPTDEYYREQSQREIQTTQQ